MSLPTADPVPRIAHTGELFAWATRLVDYLDKNIREIILQPQRITLVNGDNNNLAILGGGQIQITGPTGAFAITGIGGGSPGRFIIVINNTAQVMTIRDNNVSSAAGNRILTLVGDVTAAIALLTYDNSDKFWKVVAGR